MSKNPADEHIHLRVTSERKGAYERAAKGNLSEWCFRHLDAAANYKAPEH